jgi:hypothetical protein
MVGKFRLVKVNSDGLLNDDVFERHLLSSWGVMVIGQLRGGGSAGAPTIVRSRFRSTRRYE